MLYSELEKFSLHCLKHDLERRAWAADPCFMKGGNEFVAIKTWWFELLFEGSTIKQLYPNDLQ